MARLRELMAALDRRQPRNGRGEDAIARDAAALRTEAAARVSALERDATRAEGGSDDGTNR